MAILYELLAATGEAPAPVPAGDEGAERPTPIGTSA
jgi:hypothetical protein